MNLSQRLDQARAQREAGAVGDDGPTAYDLRISRDQAVYDGHDLRTGEELTEDKWVERDSDDASALPTWNPKRANDMVSIDLTVDIAPPPGAEVIDLRGGGTVETDDVFAMPAWARGEQVFRAEREG